MILYFDFCMLFITTSVFVEMEKLQQYVSDSYRHSTMPCLWLYVGLVLYRFNDKQARNHPELVTNKGTK